MLHSCCRLRVGRGKGLAIEVPSEGLVRSWSNGLEGKKIEVAQRYYYVLPSVDFAGEISVSITISISVDDC